MMEHIFRNINDIRVFDALSHFSIEKSLYFEDIMHILELPFIEEIQIKDSIKHLAEQHILGVVYSPKEVSSGCKICKQTDDSKLPRRKGHSSHKPIIYYTRQIKKYYMLDNKLTTFLVSAVFESAQIHIEKMLKDTKYPQETS